MSKVWMMSQWCPISCHISNIFQQCFPIDNLHPLGIPWGSLGDPRGHRLRFWAAPRQMMVDPCLVNQVFGCFLGVNKTCFTDFAPLTLGSQSTSEHQQTIDEIWSGDFSTDVAMNSLQETLKMIGIWGLSGKPAVTPWDFFVYLAKVDPNISINYSYIVCSSWLWETGKLGLQFLDLAVGEIIYPWSSQFPQACSTSINLCW